MANEYAFVRNIFLVIHFNIILTKQTKTKNGKVSEFFHVDNSNYFLSTLCSHAYVILRSFNFAFVHLKYERKQGKDKG